MLQDFKAFVQASLVRGEPSGSLIAIPGSSVARFADYHFTVGGGDFRYGQVVTDVITFVLVAAAVFFIVVRPVNALMDRYKSEPDVQSPTMQCPECLSSIPRDARRCAYCTSEQSS